MVKNVAWVAGVLSLGIAVGCGGSKPAVEETTPPVEEATAEATPPTPPAEPAAPAEPAKPAAPGEPQEVGPDIYKVALDNETVRVFEVTFAPGAKIGIHKHPDHVVYSLTGGQITITGEDGKPNVVDLKPGMAMFLPAQNHAAENTGKEELKLLVTELKKKGTAAPEGKDPTKVAKVHKAVFEDEHVRVVGIDFKKGAKVPEHVHPDHVMYIISGGKIEVTGADKTKTPMDLAAGQTIWLPAGAHAAKNIGKDEMKAVLVEIKP